MKRKYIGSLWGIVFLLIVFALTAECFKPINPKLPPVENPELVRQFLRPQGLTVDVPLAGKLR